jgi:ribosomal protein S18 acetylase RimI-like enzyme
MIFKKAAATESHIQKYRSLRLYGLAESPASFVTKYNDEIQKPLSFWQGRLENPLAHTFVAELDQDSTAIEINEELGSEQLKKGDWVAMVSASGPLTLELEKFDTAQSSPWLWMTTRLWSELIPESMKLTEVDHYHFSGVYVHPLYRSKGLASQLLLTTLGDLQAETPTKPQVLCTILVNKDNHGGRKAYTKAGFITRKEFDLVGHHNLTVDKFGLSQELRMSENTPHCTIAMEVHINRAEANNI